jgi:hypothetical protein
MNINNTDNICNIKNMVGDILYLDNKNIENIKTVLDLKIFYINSTNITNIYNIDKLILLDEIGNELRPDNKPLNAEILKGSFFSFIVCPYIDERCFKMNISTIKNNTKIKYRESLTIEYKDKETKIDSQGLNHHYIYSAISEFPLSSPSYFSLRYELKESSNIVLSIGDLNVRFNNPLTEDFYTFKFEENNDNECIYKLYYVSSSGIVKSLKFKESQYTEKYIKIQVENPGYVGNPIIYLKESKRKDVEKLENLFL